MGDFEPLETDDQPSDDLVEVVSRMAPGPGRFETAWEGLTILRLEEPTRPDWERVSSLSFGLVLQGRKLVFAPEREELLSSMHYAILPRGAAVSTQVIEASPSSPFLFTTLRLEPMIVSQMAVTLRQHCGIAQPENSGTTPSRAGSPADRETLAAFHRFLRCLDTELDRIILGPLYLQEVTYRLLRGEQGDRLMAASRVEAEGNPVTVAIRHVRNDLRRQHSVPELASFAGMSQSSFTRLFKATTGLSPYQYVKQLRIEQACELLLQGTLTVSEVATEVGYASLSHFINEFKRHTGLTPGHYAQAQQERAWRANGGAGSVP